MDGSKMSERTSSHISELEAFKQIIARQPAFVGVPVELTSQLRPDMLHFYIKDQEILREGDTAEKLILILNGFVNITRKGIFLVRRGSGEIIGEQGVIDGVPYSASAIAHDDVRVLAIPSELARQLLREPTFTMNLIKGLSAKLREATCEQAVRIATEENVAAAFRSYVHPRVLDDVLDKGRSDYTSPQYINCAILFTDMRSYTSLSLEVAPEEIVNELSRYLDAMIDIIDAHGGMIDKFIGDNVMAVWGIDRRNDPTADQNDHDFPKQPESSTAQRNDPTADQNDHDSAQRNESVVSKALDCAIEMHKAAKKYSFGGKPIEIGTGLNYGTVFCGNVGNARKRQFTVLGQPVNLASRLESLTKELSSPIVVGENFFNQLPWPRRRLFEKHDGVNVRGIGEVICYTLRRDVDTGKTIRWGIVVSNCEDEKIDAPVFKKASHSELTLLMMNDEDRCARYARRNSIPKWTTNSEDLFHDTFIDAVAIKTSIRSQYDYALMAAAAGKPTIIEKPMAPSYSESLKIARAFEKAGLPLFVAYHRRCFPKFQHLRSVIAGGGIGDIEHVRLRFRSKQGMSYDKTQNGSTLAKPSIRKLLMNWGSEEINILQFLLGDTAWEIERAEIDETETPRLEKKIDVSARIRRKIQADLRWDFAAEHEEDWVIISGDKGEVEFSIFEERPYLITTRAAGREAHPFRAPNHPQQHFIQMVVNHLSYGAEIPCDAKSAAATSLIIEKILQCGLEHYRGMPLE